jgi:hypothetical protein
VLPLTTKVQGCGVCSDGSSLVVSDEVGQIYIFGTGPGMAQKDVKYDQVGPFSNVVLGHNWFIYDLLSKDFIL